MDEEWDSAGIRRRNFDMLLVPPFLSPSFNGWSYSMTPVISSLWISLKCIWRRSGISSYESNVRGILVHRSCAFPFRTNSLERVLEPARLPGWATSKPLEYRQQLSPLRCQYHPNIRDHSRFRVAAHRRTRHGWDARRSNIHSMNV